MRTSNRFARKACRAVAIVTVLAPGMLCADEDKMSAPAEVEVTAASFDCITEMKPVRHFCVTNLLGDLQATLAVANSPTGGRYPPGSVVQLVPTEVMVKRGEGWNAATRDWEFFELEVSDTGSRIVSRGSVDVVNRFGGNCFGCHVHARPEWDLICEKDHGCDPVPLTADLILALQRTDPRCPTASFEEPPGERS